MKDLESRRKLVQIISIITVVVLLGLAAVFLFPVFLRDPKALKELFSGTWGVVIFLALQILQVFIAILPGEVVELAAGYSFGTWGGTALVYVGIAVAATLTYFLIKKFGKAAVDTLLDEKTRRKIFRVLNSDKRDFVTFLLYFIPGTPKDVFNFIVPLTKMSYGRFMLIMLVARFPAVITSTISGELIEAENWLFFGIVYGLTALLSIIGSIIYKRFMAKRSQVVTLGSHFRPAKEYASPYTAVDEAIRSFRIGTSDSASLRAAVYNGEITDEVTLVAAVQSCLISGEDSDKLLTVHKNITLTPRGKAEIFLATENTAYFPFPDTWDEETKQVLSCCVDETDVILPITKENRAGSYTVGTNSYSYELTDGVLTVKGPRQSYRLGLWLPPEATSLNGKPVRGGHVLWLSNRHKEEEIFIVK